MKRLAPLAVLVVAVVLASVLFGADPAPKMDEPVVVTRAMLADLICLTGNSASSTFTYEAGNLVVSYKEEDLSLRIHDGDPRHEAAYERAAKTRPTTARTAAAYAIPRILPMIQKYVDPNAKVVYRGF